MKQLILYSNTTLFWSFFKSLLNNSKNTLYQPNKWKVVSNFWFFKGTLQTLPTYRQLTQITSKHALEGPCVGSTWSRRGFWLGYVLSSNVNCDWSQVFIVVVTALGRMSGGTSITAWCTSVFWVDRRSTCYALWFYFAIWSLTWSKQFVRTRAIIAFVLFGQNCVVLFGAAFFHTVSEVWALNSKILHSHLPTNLGTCNNVANWHTNTNNKKQFE